MARESTGVIEDLLESIPIPRMVRVRQRLERPVLQDPGEELVRRLEAGGHLGRIESGMLVAITVGSRGISNLPRIVARIVESVRGRGGEPFLVPAMGSHGGATAEGQKQMLIGMGFDEGAVGAPIRSSMDVVRLGETEVGLPVCVDRTAYEADGIILLNRIKAHTSFEGEIESGLLKMVAIGLGKQRGADSCHQLGLGCMERSIRDICRAALPQLRILFAVGLLENAFHETCRIAVLAKDEIEDREPELLVESKRLMGRLLFDTLDVLVVDEIGKDISGTGMDTNVVGRYHTGFGSGGPDITRIAVLDLNNSLRGYLKQAGIEFVEFAPHIDQSLPVFVSLTQAKTPKQAQRFVALTAFIKAGGTGVYLGGGGPHMNWANPIPASRQFPLDARIQRAAGHWMCIPRLVRKHPIFEGLPSDCMMGATYENVFTNRTLRDLPGEPIVASIGFPWFPEMDRLRRHYYGPGDVWHGADLAVVPCGQGRVIVSQLRLIEHLGSDPVADRILLNTIRYAQKQSRQCQSVE